MRGKNWAIGGRQIGATMNMECTSEPAHSIYAPMAQGLDPLRKITVAGRKALQMIATLFGERIRTDCCSRIAMQIRSVFMNSRTAAGPKFLLRIGTDMMD
jgi:hypothetical protein